MFFFNCVLVRSEQIKAIGCWPGTFPLEPDFLQSLVLLGQWTRFQNALGPETKRGPRTKRTHARGAGEPGACRRRSGRDVPRGSAALSVTVREPGKGHGASLSCCLQRGVHVAHLNMEHQLKVSIPIPGTGIPAFPSLYPSGYKCPSESSPSGIPWAR